ncbi:hypothetical protein P175DRAFT_0428129 [Aspergillus ochraceoroseus IBT 24754]|uniref:Rhodopsin domain-containing protein n=1 Tax=Aspergillus ochraceoroseus IBT 24754 TaxID=1392256 RepID=A0A2T5M8W9_9EURO|nr:uncharacterized protein P175DRAFT_0428129 [Aspergillus ochraceoroseus IBT 24754]PTU24978.1 hypothetical protein P175DRAFT_0428129 [Aspergillus ochraceoroseus IBT 24754]
MSSNRSAMILAVSWTETCLGLVFFTLRFVSNWKVVARFRWDFAVATLTVITEVVGQIFLQFSVDSGMGHHMAELSHAQQVKALKWSWVFQLLAIMASMLGKLAILAFLIQIRGRHETKPWLLIILGVLGAAINIAVLGTILGQCTPMQKLWDDSLEGTCDPGRKINQNYSFFQASFNTFLDALLAAYPIHLFWKLQMKPRIKIALSVLMGLGWMRAQPDLLIWASTEAWIVIVVGCVPPIRPLMERVLQRLGLSSKKTSTPIYHHDSIARVAYGTNRSMPLNHPQFQSNAYCGSKTFGLEDELGWQELDSFKDPTGSNKQIVGGSKDVVVTTDIVTKFEDIESHRGPSSNDSNISSEDLVSGESPNSRNVF